MEKLKSLDQFNGDRYVQHASLNDNSPRKNGIACPDCGNELFDSQPMITLTSDPPMKNIHCESCGYKGYRIA